jgi:hypothetical protein
VVLFFQQDGHDVFSHITPADFKLNSLIYLRLDDRGSKFTTASRPALGPTQPHIQWVKEALSLRVKRSGREADHSPPSSVEVKNAWSYNSTPPIRLNGVVLSKEKQRDNVNFTLPLIRYLLPMI